MKSPYLKELLASIESRFRAEFPRWEDSQPNYGSHNLVIDRALVIGRIIGFIEAL